MNPQLVYLAQTDTTAGFLSQNAKKLSSCKQRSITQPFLISVCSNRFLKEFVRVPKRHKKLVRRAKKVTFIYPNSKALRVVKDIKHLKFLKEFGWMYSTSANKTKESFNYDYAKQKADIIVEDERGFFETTPSKIIKLRKNKIRRIR